MQLDDDELTLDSFLLFMKIPAFISSRATFQKQKVSLLKKLSSNSQTCIGKVQVMLLSPRINIFCKQHDSEINFLFLWKENCIGVHI